MNHLLKNAPLKVTDTYYVLTQSSNMTSRRTTKRSASCSPACSTAAATQALPTAATTYDALDLPLTRTISRNDATVTDTFGYNTRSELTSAQVNSAAYAYDYDNIGNRKTAQENAEEITSYQSNNLNQYTMLSVDDLTDFIPDYDADGNQTRVKTSTCIWAITYDAENRPTDFTKVDSSGSTTIHCEYDHMGRRATKQVTTNGNTTLHQRYIYRGYLQIACVDLTRAAHPALWLITWDPTQPVATRPLSIQKDATWYTYGWDLTKNICEVYGQHGYIRTFYTYTPYGQVTAEGDVTQPIQWSSEFNDTELGLVYYNYRHYNPVDGRWMGRDSVEDSFNLYGYLNNFSILHTDYQGNLNIKKTIESSMKVINFAKDRTLSGNGGPIILGFMPIPAFASSLRADLSYSFNISPCCYKNKEIRWEVYANLSIFGYWQLGLIKSKVWLNAKDETKKRQKRKYKKGKLEGTTYEPTRGMQESSESVKLYPRKEKLDICPALLEFLNCKVSAEAYVTAGAYIGGYAYAKKDIIEGENLSYSSIESEFQTEAGVIAGVYGIAAQVGIRGSAGIKFSIPYFI